MATPDPFVRKFEKLLQEIPREYTLWQWQFLYRHVLISMGMRILKRFQTYAYGPDPGPVMWDPYGGPGKGVQPSGGPGKGVQPGGGSGKGYQPAGGPGKGVQPGAFAGLVLNLPWTPPPPF